MKPLEAQTHYEALEVPVDASLEDIERAYRMVRSSYAEDSMALYTVFDDRDAAAIRERIDLAYRVLSGAESRREYDRRVLGRRAGAAAEAPEREAPEATEDHVVAPLEAFDEVDEDRDDAEFGGARLRRARMQRGIEIDQVAAITKINPSYLRLIEEEGYDDLPAPVYVRGFVSAYARAIGLDGARVSASYLGRMEQAHADRRPGRLLGRR